MNKKTWAKLSAWGGFVLTVVATFVQAHGIPQTGAQWEALAAALLVAISVHHAAETSAGHPDGEEKK